MSTRRTVSLAVGGYLATRVLSAVLLLLVARWQGPNPWVEGVPSYTDLTGLWWDAGWYERVAVQGYPVSVPAGQSAWAFYPLFPMLVRAGMVLTGGSFAVVAPTLALLAGIGAAPVLALLVRDQALGAGLAPHEAQVRGVGVVLAIGLFPAGPVLQAAYADSLALLLLVLALRWVSRRRYLLAILPALGLGLTRPVALPLVAVVVLHAWWRWRGTRTRAPDPPRRREWVSMAALVVGAGAAAVAWPVVTGVVAGRWDAYLRVQEAWRHGDSVAPVLAWFSFARTHLGEVGWVVTLAVVILGVLAVAAPPARALGGELRAWTGAYLLWLLVAVQPHSSTIRQLVLALGVPVVIAGSSRVRWAALCVVSFAAQVAWVVVLWRVGMAPAWPP